ncbi:unnamed protein product [Peronospora belbahrii]|uniref:Uncharacterized protein n=1 Tax=Peronospora belbahrii TaxID=622444 RepID=A0ABN8D071_9STRA|nr:unnamed protein product [Peronospora belbahrii]
MTRMLAWLPTVLLLLMVFAVASVANPPPPRPAFISRQQEPEDVNDFEKREIENSVPYDIRSSIVGLRAVVEWATRRTYIRRVKLQKAQDHSPALANP